MIVSCHVPKTAGTTFKTLLKSEFGATLYLDYGDRLGWTGPEAEEFRRKRGIPEAIADAFERNDHGILHGHFYVSKYANAYPQARLAAFMREPIARVISHYQFFAEHPEIEHPLVAEFHATMPSLAQWAEWPAVRNIQSTVLDVPLDNFAFIGLTEHFKESLRAFDTIFGTALSAAGPVRENVSTPIEVDAETRSRIAMLNATDIALYQEAERRFTSLAL